MKTAKYETINKATITKLRKDWLMLAKNVNRVQTIEQIKQLRAAALRWGDHLEQLFTQIRSDIRSRLRKNTGQPSYAQPVNEGWAQHYLDKQKELWDFVYEVRSIPEIEYNFKDPEEIRKRLESYGDMYDWQIDEYIETRVPSVEQQNKEAVERWQVEALKWDRRAKAKARKTWEWLQAFGDWSAKGGTYGGGEEPAQWNVREVENQNIEGFATQIIGFDTQDKFHWEQMGKLKAGLRMYKQLATQRYPWLLKNQLPIKVFFHGGPGSEGSDEAAATYEHDHIQLGFWSIAADPRRFAHIMAHEMGHHIYKTVLSKKAQTFWYQSVKGDWGPLDLREIFKLAKANESLRDLGRRLRHENPVLYLQLETLQHDPRFKELDILDLEDLHEAVRGGDIESVIHLPKNPITGYAAKNTEEAFCETIGLLVGYGPRALLPEVKKRFSLLMPNVKMSSQMIHRVAARYLKTYFSLSLSTP